MKKLFASILLFAAATAAVAQTYTSRQGYDLPDNEISVYYGQGSCTQLAMALGSAWCTAFTLGAARLEELRSTGAIGVEYHRYVHPGIAVGAVLGYEGGTMRFSTLSGEDENGEPVYSPGSEDANRFSFIEFMPSVTFKWFSLPSLSMYSRVALGAMLDLSGDGKTLVFAFQASPAGIDFGTGRFRGFLEAGFGCQGILTVGLRLCL